MTLLFSFSRKAAWDVESTSSQEASFDDSSSISSRSMRKNVRFADDLEIFEFPIVLGDSVCSSGAPIQISWKPSKKIIRNLEMHELCRDQSTVGRRTKKNLILSVQKRADILLNSGFDQDEINAATKNAKRDRRERRANRYQ
jgi:hypothetical protein